MPQIKIASANSQQSELFLLEFQGKFETNENVPLNGMEIGRLDLSESNPVYYVGNQRLIGKEVKLTKPLAILRQDETSSSSSSKEQKSITVVSIIKKKILFDSRPITKMTNNQ